MLLIVRDNQSLRDAFWEVVVILPSLPVISNQRITLASYINTIRKYFVVTFHGDLKQRKACNDLKIIYHVIDLKIIYHVKHEFRADTRPPLDSAIISRLYPNACQSSYSKVQNLLLMFQTDYLIH